MSFCKCLGEVLAALVLSLFEHADHSEAEVAKLANFSLYDDCVKILQNLMGFAPRVIHIAQRFSDLCTYYKNIHTTMCKHRLADTQAVPHQNSCHQSIARQTQLLIPALSSALHPAHEGPGPGAHQFLP